MRIEQPGNGNQAAATGQSTPAPRVTPVADGALIVPKPESVPRTPAAQQISQPIRSTLEFSIDPDTGRAVVKIIDSATRDLVRQIPMEEMLVLAKSLDQLKGLLLHTKA
ncbi:flagellar protein FlaG [Nitrosospira sp. Nl5]|uniref:flagellar protein FlaG n=1 Tax=Nitrosospira sp. Nl5 TaxID=200120 RepID=UPI00088636ED|nr:flagellar protein FlaG [Nitrosospira sp. Nl5]SCY07411.1 flagellar protein FlaG [Nitrosospira sp. Nl5]